MSRRCSNRRRLAGADSRRIARRSLGSEGRRYVAADEGDDKNIRQL